MKRIAMVVFLLSVSLGAFSQRVSYYAFGRAQASYMLESEVEKMIGFYNQRSGTDVNVPKLGAGYKFGGGIIMMNCIMGMSQHEHFMSSKIKMDEVKQGYRHYEIRHRSRNGVVGYSRKKENVEHQFIFDMGIGRSIIKTGLVNKDGFVSYGTESLTNGSYWARSFQYGLEYNYLKNWRKNLNFSLGGSVHVSKPLFLGKYEDQMDYKRASSYYVLYKDEPYGNVENLPSLVTNKYAFVSVFFGIQYQFNTEL